MASSSSTKAATAPKPDLFPFLAVLICTMGALIFLLIAFSVRVRPDQASVPEPPARPAGEPTPPEPHPLDLLPRVAATTASETLPAPPREIIPPSQTQSEVDAPWRLRLQSLQDDLAAAEAAYANAQRKAKTLRDQIAAAEKQERQRLDRAEQRRLAKNRATEEAKRKRAELVSLIASLEVDLKAKQAALSDAEARLRQAEDAAAAAAGKPRSYRFLAVDRVSGTRRHPIIVECKPDRWTLGSENVDISADLAGYSSASNPLLAAIAGLNRYYARQGDLPYVLFVVPPDGIDGFNLGSAILRFAKIPYGYELVPADMPLRWPVAAAGATDAARRAISANLAAVSRPGEPLPRSGADGNFVSRGADALKRAHQTAIGRSRWNRQLALAEAANGRGFGTGTSRRPGQPGLPSSGESRLRSENGQQGRSGEAILPDTALADLSGGRRSSPPDPAGTRDGQPGNGQPRIEPGRVSSDRAGSREPSPEEIASELVAAAKQQQAATSPDQSALSWINSLEAGSADRPRRSSGDTPGGISDGRIHWEKEADAVVDITPPSQRPNSLLSQSQTWGKSANRFIGYEKRIPLRVENGTLTSGKLKLENADKLDSRQLRRLLVELANEYAKDWGQPREYYFWRPTLLVTATPSDRFVSRLQRIANELDIGLMLSARPMQPAAPPSTQRQPARRPSNQPPASRPIPRQANESRRVFR